MDHTIRIVLENWVVTLSLVIKNRWLFYVNYIKAEITFLNGEV